MEQQALAIVPTNTVHSTSTLASSGSDTTAAQAIAPGTQAWLMTSDAQALEVKVLQLVRNEDTKGAITAILRSKLPLYIQVLTTRESLGSSEVAKSAHELRPHISKALAYHLTASETIGSTVVVQDPKMVAYEVMSVFEKHVWNFDWGKLDPFALSHDMQKHKIGNRAALTSSPGDRLFGFPDANRATQEVMDRLYYFMGYSNGVYTILIGKANKVLEDARHLEVTDFKTIQRKVTTAVQNALAEAGRDFKAVAKTKSHLTKFPHDGSSLIKYEDSTFATLLGLCQTKLDSLESDDFWEDRAKEVKARDKKIDALGDPFPPSSALFARGDGNTCHDKHH